MPQANKAKNVFDNGKTASYDIKSIVACQQSSKSSATFKLVVHRGDTERNKRYEFEAESPKLAGELLRSEMCSCDLDHSRTFLQPRLWPPFVVLSRLQIDQVLRISLGGVGM